MIAMNQLGQLFNASVRESAHTAGLKLGAELPQVSTGWSGYYTVYSVNNGYSWDTDSLAFIILNDDMTPTGQLASNITTWDRKLGKVPAVYFMPTHPVFSEITDFA